MRLLFLFFLLTLTTNHSQLALASVVDDVSITHDMPIPENVMKNIVTEKIDKVSLTKRVMVLTNINKTFSKGDFISLILGRQLVARCIVAKDVAEKELGGVKMVKIYNVALSNTFRPGMEILVLRGDDSYFIHQLENKDAPEEEKIKEEEDLYNDTNLSETDADITLDENKNRAIKTDNVIGMSYGQMDYAVSDGAGNEAHYMAYWGYQIVDNIWIEGNIGQTVINDYPAGGLDTKLTNLTFRGKYTISAPFYSYIMPYAGYQIITPDSPGAGKDDGVASEAERANEMDMVEELKETHLIFGVTVLKRLVPGWFARADLGTDILAIGFALEF